MIKKNIIDTGIRYYNGVATIEKIPGLNKEENKKIEKYLNLLEWLINIDYKINKY